MTFSIEGNANTSIISKASKNVQIDIDKNVIWEPLGLALGVFHILFYNCDRSGTIKLHLKDCG